jgi:SulP family sulfate permease
VVFQFGADLFYANASRFANNVRSLVEQTSTPVTWLVLDAGAITSVDYSAARVVRELQNDLLRAGVALVLVHAPASLQADLKRHRVQEVIGADHIFDTLHEALGAIRAQRVRAVARLDLSKPSQP